MRPSDEQVRLSLAALRKIEAADREAAGDDHAPDHAPDGPEVAVAPELHGARALPPEVLELLLAAPRVRPDAVERGRNRLTTGEPTSDDLADKVIGRLVCDRLR